MSEIDDMRDEMRRLKERIAALERQQTLRVVSPPPTPQPKDPRACSRCGCIGSHMCLGSRRHPRPTIGLERKAK